MSRPFHEPVVENVSTELRLEECLAARVPVNRRESLNGTPWLPWP